MVIDGERTYLTGDWIPDEDGDAGRADGRRRHPGPAVRALRRPARVARALAHRPRALAAVARRGRRRRGERADRATPATTTCASSTTARSARPMEAVEGTPHAYHLVPGGASKAQGRRLPPARPRLRARGLHRDRRLDRGPRGGRRRSAASSCVANGPERDEALREALPRVPERRPSPRARWATASTRPSSRPWRCDERAMRRRVDSNRRWPRITPQSPRRSTSRSCSGSRRPGCRSPAPTSPGRCSSRRRPCTR